MRCYKIKFENKWCVYDDPKQLVDELLNMIVNEEENSPITIQAIEMTEEEFEKMDEFNGW